MQWIEFKDVYVHGLMAFECRVQYISVNASIYNDGPSIIISQSYLYEHMKQVLSIY